MKNITLHVLPRQEITWINFFTSEYPADSIALDGFLIGGPSFDYGQRKVNFDHHSGVVRSATMSTCMQVYLAIKEGLFDLFAGKKPNVYINDCDQDTALAVWLLENHNLFHDATSIPNISRILNLTNYLDITAGAFPVNLSDDLMASHSWVFQPYTNFRTSGELFSANAATMFLNLEQTMSRLSALMMGQSGKVELDTRHGILWQDGQMTIVDEIGGNDARYYLYSKGMKAFIAIVAKRKDGRTVYSIGKKSRYISFDILAFFKRMNELDSLPDGNSLPMGEQAGGSDLIGGSSRLHASGLSWEQMKDIYLETQHSS